MNQTRLLSQLGAVTLAGAALAACGTKVHTSKPASTTTTSSQPTRSSKATIPPVTKPPASAPVGFNTSKTAFVLPYKLGYLPAPELALAKSDPAYATGLANLADWIDIKPSTGAQASQYGWLYVGNTNGQFLGSLIDVKTEVPVIWSILLGVPAGHPGVTMTDTSNIPIKASQLGALPSNNPNLSKDLDGHGYDIVTPTALELRAAPTGKLTVHGVVLGAICVPSPEAVVKNGRVVTPSGLTPITAGPSAVFSFTAPSSATVAPTGANTPRLYDQGANSCSSFE